MVGFCHGGEGLPQAAPEGVPRALQGELRLDWGRLVRVALIRLRRGSISNGWFWFGWIAGAAAADRGSPAAQRHIGVA